jgi:hypothetical protein
MMATGSELDDVVREATEQFLIGEAPELAGELTNALIAVSARVAHLRRKVGAKTPAARSEASLDSELGAIEEAFGQSVDLARRLSQAIRSHRAAGSYAAVASIARELGRQLGSAMPGPMRLVLRCPQGPVIATIPPSELRSVMVILVRRVIEAVSEGASGGAREAGGELSLEVSEPRASAPEARIVVAHAGLRPAAAADAADQVRELVHAWGGSVEPCARTNGGASIVVLLPSAC